MLLRSAVWWAQVLGNEYYSRTLVCYVVCFKEPHIVAVVGCEILSSNCGLLFMVAGSRGLCQTSWKRDRCAWEAAAGVRTALVRKGLEWVHGACVHCAPRILSYLER